MDEVVRYTYRLRPGADAVRALLEEWGRCRWLDFRPKFLAKSTMARKAADAAVSTIKQTLIEYAERAGRKVVLVRPAYTTHTCSRCGTRAKDRMLLDERTFTCTACGLIADRDVNAARVILAVAERGHTSVESVRHSEPPSEKVSGAA